MRSTRRILSSGMRYLIRLSNMMIVSWFEVDEDDRRRVFR